MRVRYRIKNGDKKFVEFLTSKTRDGAHARVEKKEKQ